MCLCLRNSCLCVCQEYMFTCDGKYIFVFDEEHILMCEKESTHAVEGVVHVYA